MTESSFLENDVPSDVSHNSATSSSILAGMLQRKPESWNRFAHIYAPLVYRWGRSAGLQPDDVADLTQEVFRTVAARIGAFDPDQKESAAFRSWLWGVTRNKILQHFAAAKSQPTGRGGSDHQLRLQEMTTADADIGSSGFSDLESTKVLVQNTLQFLEDTFDSQTWRCFWRLAINGDTAKEIGADLEMTPKAVRQAKYRVACRLRRELGDDFAVD